GIYAGIVLLIRGRHLEASKWWDRMRRPRAGDERSSCTRAAPGLRPGTLGSPARSWLTAARCGLPEVRKKRLTRKAPRASSQRQGETERQKARPGAVWTLRWRAERRRTFDEKVRTDCNDAPIGAPSPRLVRGTKEGRRRTRAAKEQGRWRLAFLSDATLSSSRQDEGEKYGYRPAGGRG